MNPNQVPKKNANNSQLKNQRGNTIVEVSLLLLPFLILIMGVMEFGWYFLHQHTLQYATREGMRLALVGGTLLDEQGNPLTREDSIIEQIREKAQVVMNPNDVQIWIFKVGSNYESPSAWEDLAPNAGNPADYMRISTRYDHHFLVPLIGNLFPNNQEAITLEAEATYRNELFEEV